MMMMMRCRVFPRWSPGALDVLRSQDTAIILPPEADAPQHHVGFADLGEPARGFIAARVPVRMVAEALAVVSRLDLRLRGVGGNPQHVVIRRFTRAKWSARAVAVRARAHHQNRPFLGHA